ncbi:MmgE/PrpD family protein [Amycolatopsis acidicola]|uniref:MmgE/PrpD family protein n=1 Tax=Amycolatopsis acidicola TaxID=2596893 RepID=UPI00140927C2|nr:MmgE/PrpD family protein [Amycolatopsis acidicola]
MTTAAQRLGDFIAQLKAGRIPEPVLRAGKLHALDALGGGLAAQALGEAGYAAQSVREAGTSGPATAIGVADGLPATDAAFVNGTLCHALDFDDTHPNSVVHVSAGVVPAALAAAQAHGARGADLLVAIIAGNETSIRIGNAGSGLFHARGFHPTGVCGVFGATAAAAWLRGLDSAATAHALGIAGSMASGLLEFLADGAETKRLHPGWAAQAGIAAARLAAYGATGPATVLDGARGFLAAYLHGDETDIGGQVATLGEHWVTPEIAYKPYPACHYTHAPVDALAQVLAANPVRPEEVAGITAYTDATGVSLVCAPAEDKVRPRTPYDAKFSLPYCLAYRLVHGKLDVTSFTAEAIKDELVLALTPKIGYELRQYAPAPDAFGGGVSVSTVDGKVHEAELRYQRGGSENPLSDEDVIGKYRANAELALGSDRAAALEHAVLGLEEQNDLAALAALAGAGG